jgi:hypothetical protein
MAQQSIEYANMAAVALTQSAANTTTWKKLDTQVSLTEKIAWLINRIEATTTYLASLFNGDGDTLFYALTRSNLITDFLDLAEPSLIFTKMLCRADFGAAAVSLRVDMPIVEDFSTLPGGGILTPATPLYLGIGSTGLAVAANVRMRIYYQPITLTTDQFWQLVETGRVVGS